MRSSFQLPRLWLFACLCVPATGCWNSANPSYFPYLLSPGQIDRTHAKPPLGGYFADFDPKARRIEVRPEVASIPVRGQQVLIATIYDADGKPRRKRRVEWLVEGPGTIVEVDESGFLNGRGYKVDNKYAVSYTDYFTHTIDRGNADPSDDFSIGPGQTWAVLSSAVEGLTTVTVYAPEIHDWDKNRVFVKLHYVDADYLFPRPGSARAGSEYLFSTRVSRFSDRGPVAGYKVRYRVLDGPEATFRTVRASAQDTAEVVEESPTADIVSSTDTSGEAKVRIVQKGVDPGSNRVLVEILKPDEKSSSGYSVIGRSETRIDWQAPKVSLKVAAPPFTTPDRDIVVTYIANNTGDVDSQAITLKTAIPAGMEFVSADPPQAARDGEDLLWRLSPLSRGKAHTIVVTYRSKQKGVFRTAGLLKTADGIRSEAGADIKVDLAGLDIAVEGISSAIVGETLEYKLRVENTGSIPIERVRVKATADSGLELADGKSFDTVVDKLEPGQPKMLSFRGVAKSPGSVNVRVGAVADGDIAAEPRQLALTIAKPALSVDVTGPDRVWVGQEINWKVRIRNYGDVPVSRMTLKATLPPEVEFVRASDPGRSATRSEVVWDLGSAPPRQEAVFDLVGKALKTMDKAALQATLSADPMIERDGEYKPVVLNRSDLTTVSATAGIEILGVPLIQMRVFDRIDPVQTGQTTNYSIEVRNTGTTSATRLSLTAEIPLQMRGIRGSGPSEVLIEGQKVTVAPLDSLAPGKVALYTIEVKAVEPGDARFKASVKTLSMSEPLLAEEATRVIRSEADANGPPPPAAIRSR